MSSDDLRSAAGGSGGRSGQSSYRTHLNDSLEERRSQDVMEFLRQECFKEQELPTRNDPNGQEVHLLLQDDCATSGISWEHLDEEDYRYIDNFLLNNRYLLTKMYDSVWDFGDMHPGDDIDPQGSSTILSPTSCNLDSAASSTAPLQPGTAEQRAIHHPGKDIDPQGSSTILSPTSCNLDSAASSTAPLQPGTAEQRAIHHPGKDIDPQGSSTILSPTSCNLDSAASSTAPLQPGTAEQRAIHHPDKSVNVSSSLKCEFCFKSFSELPLLKRHMKRHTHSNRFFCPACYKGFFDRYELRRHFSIHSKVRQKPTARK